jgi:hypothetical protein
VIHGTSQCGEIQEMKNGRGRTPAEPVSIVSDAAEGGWASKNREQEKEDTTDIDEGSGARGLIAYFEERAGEPKANVSQEPSGPFRGARQPVARIADKDGEAIVLDLYF